MLREFDNSSAPKVSDSEDKKVFIIHTAYNTIQSSYRKDFDLEITSQIAASLIVYSDERCTRPSSMCHTLLNVG